MYNKEKSVRKRKTGKKRGGETYTGKLIYERKEIRKRKEDIFQKRNNLRYTEHKYIDIRINIVKYS